MDGRLMKARLFAIAAIILAPLFAAPAFAACTGVFQPGQICANLGVSAAIPGPAQLGSGVGDALQVNIGAPGAPILYNGAAGKPSSINLGNATNLPAIALPAPTLSTLGGVEAIAPVAHNFMTGISTLGVPSLAQPAIADLSDLAAGVGAFLATPTSANLAAAVTNETGSGPLVFAISPALTTPNLGTPSAANLANATAYPASALAGTALPAAIVSSSLTSLGTIATGVWQGTLIGPTYGGTGVNNGSNALTVPATGIADLLGVAQTITGLKTFTATAGGVAMSGSPNISQTFSGQTLLTAFNSQLTAASATQAEAVGIDVITSSTGASPNALLAYKVARTGSATCNSGSGYCWGLNYVVNLGAGGSQRGGVGQEIDLNNGWGNYTGSPGSPYAANFYASGANTGGYSSCAFCAEFGGVGAMWQAALHGGPLNSPAYNNAFIWDESNSPTILKAAGSHGNGIDLSGAAFSGTPFKSAGFLVDASGDILGASGAFGGGARAAGTLIYSYVTANSLQIEERLENDNAGSGSAALGFQVSAFTTSGETRVSKGGIGCVRDGVQGVCVLTLYNATATTAADFASTDGVLSFDGAASNAMQIKAAGAWTANGSVATAMSSLGPTGSHATIQEWFKVTDAAGNVRYIPAF